MFARFESLDISRTITLTKTFDHNPNKNSKSEKEVYTETVGAATIFAYIYSYTVSLAEQVQSWFVIMWAILGSDNAILKVLCEEGVEQSNL